MAKCPKCRSQLPPGSAVGEVAQCRICAHIFELPDPDANPDPPAPPPPTPVAAPASPPPASAAPKKKRARAARVAERPVHPLTEPETPPQLPRSKRKRVGLPTPPYTVQASAFPNGVALDLSWKEDMGTATRVFLLLGWIIAVAGLLAGPVGRFGEPVGPTGLVIHGLIALSLFVAWAYVELNKTTVLVASGGIEVSNGPLPYPFGEKRVAARKLSITTVNKTERRGRRGNTITHWRLDASGVTQPVLKNWSQRETLEYVQLAIERISAPR